MIRDEIALNQVNRRGIWIQPQKPFLNWLRSLNHLHAEELPRSHLFLLPGKFTDTEVTEYLVRHYDAIFRMECGKWVSDPNQWPYDRSFSVFTDWFKWIIADEVFDVV